MKEVRYMYVCATRSDAFLAQLHLIEEEILLSPGVSVHICILNVRANVEVLEFQSFCIFSCILILFMILIKLLTTKANGGPAFGDCTPYLCCNIHD